MKKIIYLAIGILIACLCFAMNSFSQIVAQEPKNVAIFLYEDVELLDFAGPGEVFSASGFKTYTVSVDGKNLKSQGFVDIAPQYSIDNAPVPDIVVFPGGNSSPSANDPRVIAWIGKLNERGSYFMSVCTGAFILAKARLLDNKRVTTHWGSTRNLGNKYPSLTVLENTRWVDNEFVITTAGVSAGIDGALHFVARIKGIDEARRTARYMEYDKWDPQNGVIDKQNKYMLELTSGPEKSTVVSDWGASRAPYVGEFLNSAQQSVASGDYAKATKILENGTKIYPSSSPLFALMADVNRKLGKPAPVDEKVLIGWIREGKVDQALAQIDKDRKAFAGWKLFSEEGVKDAGYYLLEKNDVANSIKVFQLNVKEFPQSADAFDSLGEAYLKAGKQAEGIENYKKAAAMGYKNAEKVLRELGVQ